MIFKPILIERILHGDKTVTRRPIAGRTHPSFGCRYQPGKAYGIQPGMARPSVARIQVIDVQRQQLGQLDDADAVREGFSDRAAFVEYWIGLYGAYADHLPVWRIEFEVVEVLAWPCGGCDGHGYEPIPLADRAEYLDGIRAATA